MNHLRRFALSIFLFALPIQALGQTVTTGDVSGTVTDPSGAVIASASITLTSVNEGTQQNTTTNSAGIYRFAFIKPGEYRITVKAQGFKTYAQPITVSNNQLLAANVRLELGSASEVLEVTAAPTLIQTENADTQTTYTQSQLELLPAPGGDTTSYAYTTPGVVVSNGAGYGNFSSFGLPSTANLFTTNGNDNMDPFLNLNNSGASNLTLGSNELQEISVVENGYTAQYGRQAGAQVNSITKSGSNSFHGNAGYGYNGTVMNANDWFNAGKPRPHAVNNTYYASVGGPVVKNKLFFFADYEGLRMVLPGVPGLNYIPTPQFASFVQSNVPAAAQPYYSNIFGLYAGASGATGAAPISASTDANLGCGDFSGTAGFGAGGLPCALQFASNANNLITEWILATRVDYKISSNDAIFGRYHMDRGVQATGTDPINPVFNATSLQPEYDGQINWTHTLNSTTVNNFIFSAQWYQALFGPPSFSKAVATFPTTLTFSDGLFTNLGGTDNTYPQGRIPTQYQITDDFSKSISTHDIKVGVNFRRDLVSDYSALAGTSGLVTVNSMTEFANGLTNGGGTFYSANYSNVGAVKIKYYSLGAYMQDQWKIMPKLALTLALRIDRNSNPSCDHCFNRMQAPFQDITHDVSTPYNATIQTGLNDAFARVEKAVFSPRFGFAYNPTEHTVIRGGFGIFDDLFPTVAVDRFITNAPGVSTFADSGASNLSLAPGPGSVFASADAANATFQAGFASGLTLADLGGPGPGYYTMGNKLLNPKFAEWNLEVQHQLGRRLSLSLNYAGNHGYDIMTINPWLNAACNSCALGTTFGGVIGTTPTDPRFSEIVDLTNNGYSNYHGLTATAKVRDLKGFQTQFSYTWGHGLDTCSNNCLSPFVANTVVSLRYQPSPLLPGLSYGNSDYDVRHNFNLNYTYHTPEDWSNSALKRVVGGWTLGGTLFYHTGIPWSPVDTHSRAALDNVLGLRTGTPLATFAGATVGTSCGKRAAQAGIGNPAGVACVDASQFALGTLGFGNHSRNSMRGPGFFNTDLSVTKSFRIREAMSFSIGANAFNILNHQNFDLPVNSVSSGLFGQIISTIGSNTSPYGAFFGVPLNGRILQVEGKFTF